LSDEKPAEAELEAIKGRDLATTLGEAYLAKNEV